MAATMLTGIQMRMLGTYSFSRCITSTESLRVVMTDAVRRIESSVDDDN